MLGLHKMKEKGERSENQSVSIAPQETIEQAFKHIVVCCDGTGKGAETQTPTNVKVLADSVDTKVQEPRQIVIYRSGPGVDGENAPHLGRGGST